MKIIIDPLAQETIGEIMEFIDGINTAGAGERWVDRVLDFISDFAQPNVEYALCKDKELAKFRLSCISFKNWVIAFKIDKNQFIVSRIIYGPLLR